MAIQINGVSLSESNPKTAFGELSVANPTPEVQIDFPYNINAGLMTTRTNGSGTATQSNGKAVLQTTAASNSSAELESIRVLKYNPGQGGLVRFTSVFTTGATNSTQIIGIGNVEDGFFFGYNGTSFGILKRSGGQREIQTLTVTNGATVGTGNITITLDGNDTVVAVTNGDSIQEVVDKIVATDFSGNGRGWTLHTRDGAVEFIAYDSGNKSGSFAFADTDTTGIAASFAETVAGASPTDTWIAQSSWSEDVMDGTGASGVTLDQTKGNVFQIQYQWLGFGAIQFYIEKPSTGEFALVHRIEYANANTDPSILNPALPLFAQGENTSNTSNIQIQSSSMAAFVEGIDKSLGLKESSGNTKTSVGTTQTNILTIRNKNIFQGKSNRVRIKLEFMTVSADGTKNVEMQVTKNTVLGGTPSYSDINANQSVVEVDTAGTTITGGRQIFAIELGKAEGRDRNLLDLDVILHPGETITFSGAAASGTSDISAACSWIERF